MRRHALLTSLLLLATSPAFAQTLDELRRLLAEREAEVEALRERIQALEQQPLELAPIPAALTQSAETPAGESDGDVNRALERALVRQGGLLLAPGTVEAELNFSYSHINRDSISFRRDAYGPGLALRVGLPFNSQFTAAIPYVFENRESPTGSNSGDGIGDLFLGLSHQFVMEGTWWPNLIAGISYRWAIGENSLFTSPQPLAFGSGFNALTGSLTFTKRSDPLVVFGSYSYSHNFPDEKGTNAVDLGDSHGFRIGALLATSPTTSLRAAFDLALFERTQINDVPIRGTDEPAASIEIGGSFLLGDATLLDLAVGAGLTTSAPDFRITAALPVRF